MQQHKCSQYFIIFDLKTCKRLSCLEESLTISTLTRKSISKRKYSNEVDHKGCAKNLRTVISTLAPFPSFIPSPLEDSWLLPRKGFSPIWVFNQILPLPVKGIWENEINYKKKKGNYSFLTCHCFTRYMCCEFSTKRVNISFSQDIFIPLCISFSILFFLLHFDCVMLKRCGYWQSINGS